MINHYFLPSYTIVFFLVRMESCVPYNNTPPLHPLFYLDLNLTLPHCTSLSQPHSIVTSLHLFISTSQLGNKDEAMSNYISALHTYEDVQGKKSTSYVSTLANLGNKIKMNKSKMSLNHCLYDTNTSYLCATVKMK